MFSPSAVQRPLAFTRVPSCRHPCACLHSRFRSGIRHLRCVYVGAGQRLIDGGCPGAQRFSNIAPRLVGPSSLVEVKSNADSVPPCGAGTASADDMRWTDPLPADNDRGGDAGGSAVPINVEEGAPPAEPALGEDFLEPFGMSEGLHTQPIHCVADSAEPVQAQPAPRSRSTAGPLSGFQSAAGASGQRLVLSDGSHVQWEAPSWWRAIAAVKSVLARVVTTAVAVAWGAFMVSALLWVCYYVVGFVAMQLLPLVTGSVGFA